MTQPAVARPAGVTVRAGSAVAVLVLIWLLQWRGVVLQGDSLFLRDLLFFALPTKFELLSRLADGELPLWAPLLSTGMPLLADVSNQVLYPLNLLLLPGLGDPARAMNSFLVGHVLLGSLATLWLCRRLDISYTGGAVAAACYGLSGYVLSITDNVTYLPAVVWAPLVLGCLGTAAPPSRRAVVGAALALACLLLAGDALNAAVALGAAWFLGLARLGARPGPAVRAGLGLTARVAAAGALGLAVIAVQLLPTLELMAHSIRGVGLSSAHSGVWSLPPPRLIELVHPYVFGSSVEGESDLAVLYPNQGAPWAQSIYIGLIPLGLALAAAARRVPGARSWLAVAAAALVLALGSYWPHFETVHALVPGASLFRFPEKLVLWVTLALCVGSGFGVDTLRARPWLASAPGLVRTLVSVVILGSVLSLTLDLPTRWLLGASRLEPDAFWSGALGFAASRVQGLGIHALVVGACLTLLLWAGRRGAAAVGALAVIDLLFVHHAFPAAAPPEVDWPALPERGVQMLRDAGEAGDGIRIYYDDLVPDDLFYDPDRDGFPEGVAAPERGRGTAIVVEVARQQALAMKPLIGALAGVRYYNGRWSPLQLWQHMRAEEQTLPASPLETLREASVTYVLTRIWPTNLLWNQPGFEVVVEAPKQNLRVLAVQGSRPRAYWAAGGRSGDIAWRVDRPEHLELDVDAGAAPAELMVSESWFPGWTAEVDGEPATLLRRESGPAARYLSLAVAPGRHRVALRYRSTYLAAGAALSILALAVAVAAVSIRGRSGERGSGQDVDEAV